MRPCCTPRASSLLDHRDVVRRTTSRWLARQDVDDLEQEVWLRALTAECVPCAEGRLRRWLIAVARNACVDHLRRRSRVRWHALECEPVAPDAPESGRDDAERQLRFLPVALRQVVVAHYLEGLSHAEIADSTGLSYAAVVQRLSRARRKFPTAARVDAASAES